MTPQHVNSCTCQFTHKDYFRADGIKNFATYEIDYRCFRNGVTAGEGTMWKVGYDVDTAIEELRQSEVRERISKFATPDPEVAKQRELAGWGRKDR